MFARLRKGVERVLGRAAVPVRPTLLALSYSDVYSAYDEFDEHTEMPEGLLQRQYPPTDMGLPVKLSTPALLAKHAQLVSQIEQMMMLPPEEFRVLVLPVIAAFTRRVHLLPASEAHHHRGPGGLLHHSLEVAFYAVRNARFTSFTRNVVMSRRRELDRRWQVGALLAGLFHDIGKIATDMQITDETGEKVWHPHTETIAKWATQHGAEQYFVRWNPKRGTGHQDLNSTLMALLLEEDLLHWLCEYGDEVLHRVVRTLNYSDCDHPFAQIISRADSTSVTDDITTRSQNGASLQGGWAPGYGAHVIDTICGLVSMEKWSINAKGSRIWILNDGVYIVWTHAIAEVRKILDNEGVRPLPKSPELYAESLIDEGVAEARIEGDEKHLYWDVAPDVLTAIDGKQIWLRCLKLKSAGFIFKSITPPPPTNATVGKSSTPKKAEDAVTVTAGDTLPTSQAVNPPDVTLPVDLDAEILSAPKAPQPRAKAKPSITLEPVSIDDIIGEITAKPKSAAAPQESTNPAQKMAPMFALDNDDDLFGASTPAKPGATLQSTPASKHDTHRIEIPLLPNVGDEVKNDSTKANPKPSISKPTLVPASAVAAPAPILKESYPYSTHLESKFGKFPEIAALIGRAIEEGNFWLASTGRVFLPQKYSAIDKELEKKLLQNGWLWRNPMRGGQATTVLGEMVGHTFDSMASRIIINAHGSNALKKANEVGPTKGKEESNQPQTVERAVAPAPLCEEPQQPLKDCALQPVPDAPKPESPCNAKLDLSLPRQEQQTNGRGRKARKTKQDRIEAAVRTIFSELATSALDEPGVLYVSTKKLTPLLQPNQFTRTELIKGMEQVGYFAAPHKRGLRMVKAESLIGDQQI